VVFDYNFPELMTPGHQESPGNGVFDYHRPKLMALDLEKVPAKGFWTTMTLN